MIYGRGRGGEWGSLENEGEGKKTRREEEEEGGRGVVQEYPIIPIPTELETWKAASTGVGRGNSPGLWASVSSGQLVRRSAAALLGRGCRSGFDDHSSFQPSIRLSCLVPSSIPHPPCSAPIFQSIHLAATSFPSVSAVRSFLLRFLQPAMNYPDRLRWVDKVGRYLGPTSSSPIRHP